MANEFKHNGAYPNPVSVLFSDIIEYKITAVNASLLSGKVIIRDTLPPYLNYVTSSIQYNPIGSPPPTWTMADKALFWESSSVASLDSVFISYELTPEEGVSASQPMYINYAWVQLHDTLLTTNKTYHQGAGVSVVTFSALFGGNIYNADAQALDYRTSPRSGILVVPDSGYRFAGWSHDEYISLKGEVIKADSGIIYYDALTIYGNVELRAVFEPDDDSEIKKPIEEITTPSMEEKIWSAESILYVKTIKSSSIVRIYRPDGVLYDQRTILTEGTTAIQLPQGIYIVTLNNGIGHKVIL
jgi:hypothetical protein